MSNSNDYNNVHRSKVPQDTDVPGMNSQGSWQGPSWQYPNVAIDGGTPHPDTPVSRELYEQDRRSTRIKTAILIIVLVALFVFSLLLGYAYQGTVQMEYHSFDQVLSTLWNTVYLGIGQLMNLPYAQDAEVIADAIGPYHDIQSRIVQSATVLLCAVLIAVAGMLFQIVFRNPIASPTILGVNSGVQMGYLIMFFLALLIAKNTEAIGGGAVNNAAVLTAVAVLPGPRFFFGFVGGLLSLIFTFLLGRLIGGAKHSLSIAGMLLAGAILSQVFAVFYRVFTSATYFPDIYAASLALEGLQEKGSSPFVLVVVVAVSLVTFGILVSRRHKYNLLNLSDEEMQVGGLSPTKTRVVVLGIGSLMIIVAQSAIGAIAMVSLVIPFLARGIFGVDFRRQLLGSVLIGAVLVMVCYILASVIPFYDSGISTSVFASIIMTPLYAVIMATNERAMGAAF